MNQTAKQRLLGAVEDAVKNKDNKKLAIKFETQFEPDIIIKTQEDKKQEELDKYFEDYTHYICYDSSNPRSVLRQLIIAEAPIHIDDIYDFMKTTYGRKATKKFKNEVNNILYNLVEYDNIVKSNMFFFPRGFSWKNMKVRIRESPKIECIHSKELEKSIVSTLKLQYSSSREDLIKSASKHLGFKSVRANVKSEFEIIIYNLISRNIIRDNDGIIELVE